MFLVSPKSSFDLSIKAAILFGSNNSFFSNSETCLTLASSVLGFFGTVTKTEILDHARMNKPGQGFYKVLAESALRAIQLCQPLRVPNTGYERWKDLQLNFDAREMLEG